MDNPHAKKSSLFLGIGLLIFLVLTGCGKKEWPSVVDQEEVFSFEQVSGARKAGCLNLEATLSGAVDNVHTLVLEFEALAEPCPDCPFTPTARSYLDLNGYQVKRQGNTIWISQCNLEKDTSYRVRLLGVNVFPGIQTSSSEVVMVEKP